MDYFFWGILALGAYFCIKEAKSEKMKKIFIGFFGLIFILCFAYISGEQVGEAFYYLTHPEK